MYRFVGIDFKYSYQACPVFMVSRWILLETKERFKDFGHDTGFQWICRDVVLETILKTLAKKK
jgi:hypothetical protein